nr:MAG: lipase [Hyphomicrobiales bacterium]
MRISFIGDSLVAGTGDPDFLGWPGRLSTAATQRGHEVTCYNLGIRKDTSADILKRWRAEAGVRVAAGQDNRLVFQFGVNDTKDEGGKLIVEPVRAIAQAREILGAAKAWLPTLMVGPPPIEDATRNVRIVDLSARLEKLCDELGIPYFDSFTALGNTDIWTNAQRAGDGTHPIAGGYEEWARLLDNWDAWRDWTP